MEPHGSINHALLYLSMLYMANTQTFYCFCSCIRDYWFLRIQQEANFVIVVDVQWVFRLSRPTYARKYTKVTYISLRYDVGLHSISPVSVFNSVSFNDNKFSISDISRFHCLEYLIQLIAFIDFRINNYIVEPKN